MFKNLRKARAARRYQAALNRRQEYLATKTLAQQIERRIVQRYVRSL